MNRSACRVMVGVAGLAVLGMTATLAGALAPAGDSLAGRSVPGSTMAMAPEAGCALPSEPQGIPAAIDAAISGPADKDRACMKALLVPEARMMFVSLGTDAVPTYELETLDDWIAGVKARGHALLEEKQLKFHIERYGNLAHLWSSYALHSDGKQVARAICSVAGISAPPEIQWWQRTIARHQQTRRHLPTHVADPRRACGSAALEAVSRGAARLAGPCGE